MSTPMPQGWGEDPLSKFLLDAYSNCIASFVNYDDRPVMMALREVDTCFRLAIGIPFKPKKELFLPCFIGRCHAAYLCSVQLSMAGQVPEAYPSIRLCLETALYALFIQDDPTITEEIPSLLRTWMERDTSKKAEQRCRKTFAYGEVRGHLVSRLPALGERVGTLYERTITCGAHPNFFGQSQASDLPSTDGGNVKYLLPDSDPCRLCIQTTVEAGLCVHGVFGLILGDRYEQAGIPARIDKVEWKPDPASE